MVLSKTSRLCYRGVGSGADEGCVAWSLAAATVCCLGRGSLWGGSSSGRILFERVTCFPLHFRTWHGARTPERRRARCEESGERSAVTSNITKNVKHKGKRLLLVLIHTVKDLRHEPSLAEGRGSGCERARPSDGTP